MFRSFYISCYLLPQWQSMIHFLQEQQGPLRSPESSKKELRRLQTAKSSGLLHLHKDWGMTLTKTGCKMWIQKWHQTNIVFWKWLWAMAKSIQHLCISRFSVTFRTTSNDSATWDNGQLEIWPHLFPKILEISWDDMHVSSHMFHCVSFMIVHYSTTLFMFFCHDFTTLLILFSWFHHIFHVVSRFLLLFPTCSMAFFEKNTPASTVVACSKRRQSGQRRAGPRRHSARQGLQNLGETTVEVGDFHMMPMVMTNSLLLKMNIEIVDFPIKHGDFP